MAKTWKSNTPRHDHYQEVTDQIVAALDKGVLPWRRQWVLGRCDVPINGVTGHIYRGINRVVLDMLGMRFGADPRWCSYRQALARGWQVRGGERGTRIYFYRRIERTARDGDQVRAGDEDSRRSFFPLLRAYTVFHASQIDGIPAYVAPLAGERAWQTPEAVQTILDASGIEIRSQGHRACYVPDKDIICLPPAHAFESADKWAEVALHEFAHATGFLKRLDRKLSTVFGSAEYAFEELIVSLATSMVGPELGISVDLDNQASYIDDWLGALRRDKKAIFRAAAEAQRVADFILGLHPDYAAVHAVPTNDAEESADVPADDAVGEAA
jgi:antirestriction protein ArdC